MNVNDQNSDAAMSNKNIAYYNNIAHEYETILNNEPANKVIRDLVAKKFIGLVKQGLVLDFGAGTGLDLNWMVSKGYKIFFCEPSAAMREIAIQRSHGTYKDASINFLKDNETDFRNWTPTLPFAQKVNAILCNFAVVNCIPDIDLLFEKFALVIESGGVLAALVLESSLKKRLRANFKGTSYSFLSGRPVIIHVDYKSRQQSVYLHTKRAIGIASKKYFDCISYEPLSGYGFSLILLMRK